MTKKVEIPDEFYERFEDRAEEKGLESADEYVRYVLKQTYEKLEPEEETYSEEEEEKVKNKLEDLGYM